MVQEGAHPYADAHLPWATQSQRLSSLPRLLNHRHATAPLLPPPPSFKQEINLGVQLSNQGSRLKGDLRGGLEGRRGY